MRPSELFILYEDNHLIACIKPAGVLTHGDHTGATSLLDQVKSRIKTKYEKPGNVYLGIVHRLDQAVAGVIVFARTSKAAARLSAQFRDRTVEKRYLALVESAKTPPDGDLQSNLSWSESAAKAFCEPGGKPSRLTFKTLKVGKATSLLEVKPITGRKHQIRVQLSDAGFPIQGDRRYGAKTPFRSGIGLVCESLEFEHPTKKERLILIADSLRAEMEGLVH